MAPEPLPTRPMTPAEWGDSAGPGELMRYGVIADIHANLPALRAMVEALRQRGAERWLVAGDVVGYGAQPNECIEEIVALNARCVAGNHDLIAIGQLREDRCIALARASLRWTRSVLSSDSRTWLETLPLRISTPGGIVMAHGSLDDPEEYTTRRVQALAQLDEVKRLGGRVLVLGHTHRPWAFSRSAGPLRRRTPLPLATDDVTLLNPGAVGQSRQLGVRARGLLIDTKATVAEFSTTSYDIDSARAALRTAGLSPEGVHLRPSLAAISRRALRSGLDRAFTRSRRLTAQRERPNDRA